MTQVEQQSEFIDALDRFVSRYMAEYDLTVASVVGCLECEKQALVIRAYGIDPDGDNLEDWEDDEDEGRI